MISLVTARFTPRSTKKVPRVTMKLGSPVFTTRNPLMKPIARAMTREATTATQTFTPQWVIMMPVIRPVVPVIAPAERSNSPPIMSSATATAMMANDEAVKIHVLAPAGCAKAAVVSAKYTKMISAATAEPTSGLRSRAEARWCDPRRSSAGPGDAAGAGAVVVMGRPPGCAAGSGCPGWG